MKKKNGFTLIELLAVIVILAIIMVIAIPSILEALNSSRKDSFYLYAQRLYSESISKYTRDMDENKENLTCAVYDIKTDLGLNDTGSFDGWVRVSRKAVSSGKNNVTVELSTTKELQSVKFCVGKPTSNGKCVPNETYPLADETKKVTIVKPIKEDQVFCVDYQVPNANNVLVSQERICKNYSDGVPYIDTYAYEVKLALTNNAYSVQDVILSEEIDKASFFEAMDSSNVEISKPSCSADDNDSKGGTTTKQTNISENTQSTRSTQIVTGPGVTTRNTNYVTGPTGSTNPTGPNGTTIVTAPTGNTNPTGPNGTTIVSNSTSNQQGSTNPTGPSGTSYITNGSSSLVSNERSTTYIDITTKATLDSEIMLETLSIDNYNINFNPGIFTYDITVPNNVTSLNVKATTKLPSSKLNITGQNGFAVGENIILIEVFDENTGKRGYYRIFVKRFNEQGVLPTTSKKQGDQTSPWDPNSGLPDPSLDDSNASLKALIISGYKIDFNPEVYEYTLETKGESSIGVSTATEKPGAKVLVTGNKDIVGDGEIVIKVSSKNGYYNKTYKIKLIAKKQEESSTKTFRYIAIGLLAILLIVAVILALTKKNRARRDYDGSVDATSGPGTQNFQNGQNTQNPNENALPQTPAPGVTPTVPQGQVQNPVPVGNNNVAVGVPSQALPTTPVVPTPQVQNPVVPSQDNTQIPPQ